MTLKQIIVHTLLLLALCVSSPILAQSKPGIGLFAYDGSESITHDVSDPLLLTVALENSAAISILRANQRKQEILQAYSETDEYKTLSELEQSSLVSQYAAQVIPEFTLGSKKVTLASLLTFHVRNADGNTINLAPRSLASNMRVSGPQSLNQGNAQYLRYLIDAAALSELAPGGYQIAAMLDSRQQVGMWNGIAYSKPMKVDLSEHDPSSKDDSSEYRSIMHNDILMHDEQFVAAEEHAQLWITRNPDSVDAWAQLGEAQQAQGNNAQALISYDTAIGKFRLKNGNRPQELPEEILDRIKQIESSD